MAVDPTASLEITAFDWVLDFARGSVRDLRSRWAYEEIGIDYAEHLIGPFSVAEIAMAPALREGVRAGLIAEHARLHAYLDRCLARPAFQRALDTQMRAFNEEARPAADERMQHGPDMPFDGKRMI